MLCEQCQVKEATVHFSAVAWPSGEVTKHFCEVCYPQVEAERTASYSPPRKALPFIDVEHLTAQEYFDICANAQANSVDAPAARFVSSELKRFPATRERLAKEILIIALQSLENRNDDFFLIGLGSCFGNSVPGAKTSGFVQLLEKIFSRSVELMSQSLSPPSDHPFGIGLTVAGNALRQANPERFSMMLEDLKSQHRGRGQAQAVLDYFERQAQKWGPREAGQ